MTWHSILFFYIFLFSVPSFSSSSTQNSIGLSKMDHEYKKNIYKGNHEISLSGDLSYNSYSKTNFSATSTYRHFFWDKISIGPHLGFTGNDHVQNYNLGLSARWYFYELGSWAFHATQGIFFGYYNRRYRNGERYSGESSEWLTSLGTSYFFTPEIFMGVSLDHRYTAFHRESVSGADFASHFSFGIIF